VTANATAISPRELDDLVRAHLPLVGHLVRELLTAGQRAVQETMLVVSGSAQTYGRRGETVAATPRTRLIDEAM